MPEEAVWYYRVLVAISVLVGPLSVAQPPLGAHGSQIRH